jgi:hypothetical protein
MKLRQGDAPQAPQDPLPAPDVAAHQDARASGAEFLAAGDAAIQRALSRDSQAFLRANRQQGGE